MFGGMGGCSDYLIITPLWDVLEVFSTLFPTTRPYKVGCFYTQSTDHGVWSNWSFIIAEAKQGAARFGDVY